MSRFNIVLPAVAPGLKPSYNSEVCPSGLASSAWLSQTLPQHHDVGNMFIKFP